MNATIFNTFARSPYQIIKDTLTDTQRFYSFSCIPIKCQCALNKYIAYLILDNNFCVSHFTGNVRNLTYCGRKDRVQECL